MRISLALLILSWALAGCASHVLPEHAREQVDPSVDFTMVKADPQRYAGTTLMLGGRIIENRALADGSLLEILKYTTDRRGRPLEVDEEGGRLLVRSQRFLDPEIYGKERLVTFTATVRGEETRTLNERQYVYPAFDLRALYVWRSPFPGYYDQRYPYHFRPLWYDPWYDPFWPTRHPWYRDPFWPRHRRW